MNTPWIMAREDGSMFCERCGETSAWIAGSLSVDKVARRMRAFLNKHGQCMQARAAHGSDADARA